MNRIVVGASLLLAAHLAAFPVAANLFAQCPYDYLPEPALAAGGDFGRVADSGPGLFVTLAYSAAGDAALAVYRQDAFGGWSAPETVPLGQLSLDRPSISLDGDLVAVGFPFQGAAGEVHVLRDGPIGFVPIATLTAPIDGDGLRFGRDVAASDGRVLVGASGVPVGTFGQVGEAYLFEESASGWTSTATFACRDPFPNRNFGSSLALDGDRIAVAEFSIEFGVSMYRESETGWALEETFPWDGGATGRRIVLRGEDLFYSAPGRAGVGPGLLPAVHHVVHDGSRWASLAVLVSPFGFTSGYGSILDLKGDRLLVGRDDRFYSTLEPTPLLVYDRGLSGFYHLEASVPPGPSPFQRRRDAWLAGREVWESVPRPVQWGSLRHTLDPLTELACFQPSANSTGRQGRLQGATGCPTRAFNDLDLVATFLPPGEFAILVVGTSEGARPGVFGGPGVLCVDGDVGRGFVRRTSLSGTADFAFDVFAVPQPAGAVVAVAGSSWVAQVLHRDGDHPGGTGATNAVLVHVR
ncbi:MAG: hypothetical protein AAFP86_01160 [Planctomycetota bacterium]